MNTGWSRPRSRVAEARFGYAASLLPPCATATPVKHPAQYPDRSRFAGARPTALGRAPDDGVRVTARAPSHLRLLLRNCRVSCLETMAMALAETGNTTRQ